MRTAVATEKPKGIKNTPVQVQVATEIRSNPTTTTTTTTTIVPEKRRDTESTPVHLQTVTEIRSNPTTTKAIVPEEWIDTEITPVQLTVIVRETDTRERNIVERVRRTDKKYGYHCYDFVMGQESMNYTSYSFVMSQESINYTSYSLVMGTVVENPKNGHACPYMIEKSANMKKAVRNYSQPV